MNVYKVFGPPGTGKTTFLLNRVNELLQQDVSPNSIGYFSFTKKAANEARDRALDRFTHLDRKDFGYFRTLHSLAYLRLGMRPEKMMKDRHYKDFARRMCIDVSVDVSEESYVVRPNNPILNIYNLARLRMANVREEYNRSNLDISWHHFEYIVKSFEIYKKQQGLIDFTDLLEMFVDAKSDYYPKLTAVFVDEAQDLSPIQWKIVKRLIEHANKSWIAGDDDQAIFSFSGADVKSFLSMDGEQVILDRSYRIPRAIHKYANEIVNRIKYRVEKQWMPRKEAGCIFLHQSVYDIDIENKPGTWLILASTNYMLNDVHEHLKSLGLLFERNHVRSIPEKIVEAVCAWEDLRKHKSISSAECKALYPMIGAGGIKHGYKNFKGPDDGLYNVEDLQSLYGLQRDINLPWFEALKNISDDKIVYMQAALRRKQSLRGTPRISLSTIHGAKGGEADHVVILSDLSSKFMDEYYTEPDNTFRLYYVGITRTKNSLHIVYPKDKNKAFPV